MVLHERAELPADLRSSLDGEPEAEVEAARASEIERRGREASQTRTMTSPGRPCVTSYTRPSRCGSCEVRDELHDTGMPKECR